MIKTGKKVPIPNALQINFLPKTKHKQKTTTQQETNKQTNKQKKTTTTKQKTTTTTTKTDKRETEQTGQERNWTNRAS